MTTINIWGPIIWKYFHVLIAQIKEESFNKIYKSVFNHIYSICEYLPCPSCAEHAKVFLSKVKYNTIDTKENFKKMMHFFHNSVNTRINNILFEYNKITIYDNVNVIQCFNEMINVYHTRGNMKLLNETFRRQNIIKNASKWLRSNIIHLQYKS